jgi:hypothetical protein
MFVEICFIQTNGPVLGFVKGMIKRNNVVGWIGWLIEANIARGT